jgi:hypothetical protein
LIFAAIRGLALRRRLIALAVRAALLIGRALFILLVRRAAQDGRVVAVAAR